ncbi:MAG: FecR family protein [Tannerellaceae bacterium]|nr:FecR family protein [Tannerellaceae bacterium]
MSAVASLLLLVSSYLFYQWNSLEQQEEEQTDIVAIAREMAPVNGEGKGIQLIVGGEKAYVLNQQTADIEMNEEGDIHVDADLLVTAPDKVKENKVNYNQLVVPKGARSRLTLPDGTTMHINSGSQVIFPETFTADKREIFVNGEVFLDVVSDKQCPFFVHTRQMTVKVTGTSLNVSAYEEDIQTVVLVSGAVTVKTLNNEENNLLPNQILVYNDNVSTISTVDVSNYISWKEGYLLCDRDNLPALMRKLSRFYGKAIHCDPSLSLYQGNGKLDLKENFDQLMEGLKELYPIRIIKDENEETYYIQNSKKPH